MKIKETIKYLAYRMPIVSRTMKPHYPYKVDPGQLNALINLIDETRSTGGAIVEIGVAQGFTSAFIMEHLQTTGDSRELLLFDTFSGFTKESIDHEFRSGMQKYHDAYGLFKYGSERIFRRNLKAAGYARFKTFSGDASKFDWGSIGPVSVVLLDIDVYKPTREILGHIWPHLTSPGGIVVDDCLPGGPWEGSLQAYQEFIAEIGFPFTKVGGKGGLVRKSS